MKKITGWSFLLMLAASFVLSPQAYSQQYTKKMVGYQQEWVELGNIDYEHLTHINFAFVVPSEWGQGYIQGLTADQDRRLRQLVTQAHAKNVKVLLSIGGWSVRDRWAGFVGSPAMVNQFVIDATYLVDHYGLDGVDLDWEYPASNIQPCSTR